MSRKNLILLIGTLILLSSFTYLSANGNKFIHLSKIIGDNSFQVTAMYSLTDDEIYNHWVSDKKTLLGIKLNLFYNMGKIHGYAVFINKDNDFAVVDNTNLKIVLYNKYMRNKHKTFFIKIKSYKFQKLQLSRGDSIIAFPINKIVYGDLLPEGSIINVKAECFHLETGTQIAVY